jgi:hypothetical protein
MVKQLAILALAGVMVTTSLYAYLSGDKDEERWVDAMFAKCRKDGGKGYYNYDNGKFSCEGYALRYAGRNVFVADRLRGIQIHKGTYIRNKEVD